LDEATLARLAQHVRREIDSGYLEPVASDALGEDTRAATDVEDGAGDQMAPNQVGTSIQIVLDDVSRKDLVVALGYVVVQLGHAPRAFNLPGLGRDKNRHAIHDWVGRPARRALKAGG